MRPARTKKIIFKYGHWEKKIWPVALFYSNIKNIISHTSVSQPFLRGDTLYVNIILETHFQCAKKEIFQLF